MSRIPAADVERERGVRTGVELEGGEMSAGKFEAGAYAPPSGELCADED